MGRRGPWSIKGERLSHAPHATAGLMVREVDSVTYKIGIHVRAICICLHDCSRRFHVPLSLHPHLPSSYQVHS